MYVYELAIQLGKRSTDLSDAADRLGIGPLIAASELTADQHARLVHHFTGQVVGAPSGPSSGPMGAPGGPGAASGPMPPPPGGGRQVPWPMVVVGAVLAIGALVAGSYVLVGGQQDEFERQVDAQAAAEARGEIPESEPTDDGEAPAPGPEGAPTTAAPGAPVTTTALDLSDDQAVKRARCAASQKVADLDDEGDVLNTDAPSWDQFTWAVDQAEAMLPELKAAYDELRAVVPPPIQADIDGVWRITEDMTRQLSAVTSPDQLRSVVDAINAREAELAGPLMRLDAYVQDECDITIAD